MWLIYKSFRLFVTKPVFNDLIGVISRWLRNEILLVLVCLTNISHDSLLLWLYISDSDYLLTFKLNRLRFIVNSIGVNLIIRKYR